MPRLSIVYKDPKSLKSRSTNLRTHSKKQIEQIKRSIQEFGFVQSVLVDRKDGIIAGHARTVAAIELGISDVPTICADHFTPDQVRAWFGAIHEMQELLREVRRR